MTYFNKLMQDLIDYNNNAFEPRKPIKPKKVMVKKCNSCDILIEYTSYTQKYCKECKKKEHYLSIKKYQNKLN